MAVTWIKALHSRSGGIASTLGNSLDYIGDKDKTNGGELVDDYECDSFTVQNEFLLSKRVYEQQTGRDQGKNDVIAYHMRMSFKPGEVTGERALELGRELAMRWTKGKHQFIVAAHTNTKNPHVHIIYNSVNLDCTGKWQDFKRSAIALRRVSDQICLENGLSIIEKPGLSKGYNRKEYLAGKYNLLIDIQSKMQQGYGKGYEHWAKIFNLKESAKTLLFLQENKLADYDILATKTQESKDNFNAMSERVNEIKTQQQAINDLQRHIGNYRKTKEVYSQYRAAKNKSKFYAENEQAIIKHEAAKAHFDSHKLDRLPSIKSLQQEYATLETEKRKIYSNHKTARNKMLDLMKAKQNVDLLLNPPSQIQKSAQQHER